MFSPILILSLALLSPSFGHCRKIHGRHSVEFQKQIDDGIGKFGIELHKSMMMHSYRAGENIFMSPISVYFSLALAHLGTSGETRDELKTVMGLPIDEELALRSHQVLSELYRHLQHSENANVSIANGLFLQTGNTVRDLFMEQIKKYYDCSVTKVDFTEGDATDAINKWFKMKTGGKISHFYDQTLSQDVKLLFANALTFSSTWDRQFMPEHSKMEIFHGDDDHDESINMLHKIDFLPYFNNADDKYEAVGLPFKNGEHYMWIILPNEGVNLIDILDTINYETIQRIMSLSSRRGVDIKLPQISFKTHQQIQDMLQLMGIRKLFESPDLGNILTQMKLKLTQVWHNAELRMNETGIDAMVGTTQEYKIYDEFVLSEDMKEFFVDRPFMFFIHHPRTKSVMFYGSVHRLTGN